MLCISSSLPLWSETYFARCWSLYVDRDSLYNFLMSNQECAPSVLESHASWPVTCRKRLSHWASFPASTAVKKCLVDGGLLGSTQAGRSVGLSAELWYLQSCWVSWFPGSCLRGREWRERTAPQASCSSQDPLFNSRKVFSSTSKI